MNSPESWDLRIDSRVLKICKKLPRRDSEVLWGVIKLLPDDPYFGNIQKMWGQEDVWRRRVGAYRVFYKLKVAEKVILVFHVERRTSKTY